MSVLGLSLVIAACGAAGCTSTSAATAPDPEVASGAPGSNGYNSLSSVVAEPAGPHCPAGGERVEVGVDDGGGTGTSAAGGAGGGGATASVAGDGVLEPGEVRAAYYVCNGFNTLASVTVEPAGPNCADGGQKIQTGIDDGSGDGAVADGILQPAEVDTTSYVCNGAMGAAGPAGAMGVPGANGTPGGAVHASLVTTTTEVAGANCPAGGQRLDAGTDDGSGGGVADDGVLQAGEIRSTAYVCNGAAGSAAYASLVTVTTIAPGTTCPNGGSLVSVGRDDGLPSGLPGDGILQSGEVDSISPICNGTKGANGTNGTDGTDGANGTNGTDGANGTNGTNGTDGYTSLLTVTAVPAGSACATGGQHIQAGLDNGAGGGTARDGLLQAGEITTDRYVCNGLICSTVPGNLDQSQLQNTGDSYLGLFPGQQPVGQSFVAGASGMLTGIEVSVHNCGRFVDPGSSVQLTVTNDSGTVLATAAVLDSQFDNACTSGLTASSITGTLFDLTPSCAFVTAGQALSFSLAFIDVTSGACNSGMCNDGSPCFGDFMCQPALDVSTGSGDTYGPGTDTVRGIPDSDDLVFKTFVR